MQRLLVILVWFCVASALGTLAAQSPVPKFEAQTISSTVAIGYGLAIGDVDGDGKPDILLADKRQIAWYRNGDWKKFIMAADLTLHDNVCIAARDLDGDGRVEVAVGANWNPGETGDAAQSGAVYYLVRPQVPEGRWESVKLHHEPTVHRMAWLKAADGKYQLVVVPLHGRGNKNGQGAGARVLAYDVPADPHGQWNTHVIDDTMHVTHNFDVVRWDGDDGAIVLGGREGVVLLRRQDDGWAKQMLTPDSDGISEVRVGRSLAGRFLATVEPFHGNRLAAYTKAAPDAAWQRTVLAEDLKEGHGLACADLLGLGFDQIVVGWRNPNAQKKVGIRLYVPPQPPGSSWTPYVIDDNTLACEDLKVADLDGDGRPDIVASGRSTRNLVIYWNKTEVKK